MEIVLRQVAALAFHFILAATVRWTSGVDRNSAVVTSVCAGIDRDGSTLSRRKNERTNDDTMTPNWMIAVVGKCKSLIRMQI